jgi:hypothetical protein
MGLTSLFLLVTLLGKFRWLVACVVATLLSCASARADLIVTISDNGSDLTFDDFRLLDTSTLGSLTLVGGFAGSFNPSRERLSGSNPREYLVLPRCDR